MKITAVRSDNIYRKIAAAPPEKKNDIYRYELMRPFKKKWDCYSIPLKAGSENGYDVIMASSMLGHLLPAQVDLSQQHNIDLLSSDLLWAECQKAIEISLACFSDNGITLPVKEYLYSILLANPENPYVVLSKGYSGDGGIPGYIFSWLIPTDYTLKRLPACLAHETNHNIRYQYIKWKNDITLGEMIVSEGLAENFAVHLYGEELAGPWVSESDIITLERNIKPMIYKNLHIQGLDNLNAYLYGDEIALLQNSNPAGVPYCAGYACGYHLIQYFLKKTGKSITEATLLPAGEILDEVKDFWGNGSVPVR